MQLQRSNQLLLLGIIAVLTLFALPVRGAPADALRLYVGANGVWLDGPAAEWPVDYEGTVNLSASLTPHITLTSEYAQGLEHDYRRWNAGARITATDAQNPNFNMSLGWEWRDGTTTAVGPGEWATYATVGWRPWPVKAKNLTLGAKSSLGMTSDRTLTSAAIRWMLPVSIFK